MKIQKRTLFPIFIGFVFLLLGGVAILMRISPLLVWVTPFCWTGYILLIDSYLYQKRGSSLIQDHPRHAFLTVPISMGLWLIFEGYNLLLKNWEYLNVPPYSFVKYLGFAWSFGTILLALLETNDLLEYWGCFRRIRVTPFPISSKALVFSFLLGCVFLIYPLLTASPYDFPPVWLGFIFLLEPLNYRFGETSLLKRLEKGDTQRLCTLLLSGGIMGLLWEFWNYWAEAKWIYRIPAPVIFRIFEMPLLGFLAFFPFAVEFYMMYHFVLLFLKKRPLLEDR